MHKTGFDFWLLFMVLHVFGHLKELPLVWHARAHQHTERPWDDYGSGRGARTLLLAGALIGGLVLALFAESQFGLWAHFNPHHFH